MPEKKAFFFCGGVLDPLHVAALASAASTAMCNVYSVEN